MLQCGDSSRVVQSASSSVVAFIIAAAMPFVLALDQGTTSSRAIVFDERARCVAMAQTEFRQIFPQPGWVEHDAEEIWAHAARGRPRGARQRAASPARDLAAIGITNQRETTVLWDRRTGRAARATPSSGRTAAPRELLRRAQARRARAAWSREDRPRARPLLLRHEDRAGCWTTCPARAQRAERGELAFGTIDTLARLEAHRRRAARHRPHATPRARCSSTSTRGAWDDELLALFGVPRARAARGAAVERRDRRRPVHGCSTPRFRSPASPATSRPRSSARPASTPGMAKNTYGTGCFMLLNTGAQPVASQHGLLDDRRLAVRDGRAELRARGQRVHRRRGRAVAARRARPHQRRSREVEALAASVPDSGGVYLVPAFAGLGAPHWDRVRARRDRRPHARHDRGAHRARRARVDRVPDGDVLRAMQNDCGRRARASCASTAARRPTTC